MATRRSSIPGGEALWENRYDLQQSSYPGGNIYSADSSFEFVAAGDALVEMGKLLGKGADADKIAGINAKARALTEKYYWMDDLGFYAQGMSIACDGQLNRYPMANINANVLWSGYGKPGDRRSRSNVERMMEYLMEDNGIFNPIVGYDVTVGMLQGQCLHSLAAINHPWSEKAFYALLDDHRRHGRVHRMDGAGRGLPHGLSGQSSPSLGKRD